MALRWMLCCLALISCGRDEEPDTITPPTGGPLILATADSGNTIRLRPIGRNGRVVTWQSRDGIQLALADGVLIATRGLGFDLMIADQGLRPADRQKRAVRYSRQYRHLDGTFTLGRRSFSCVVSEGQQDHLATLAGPVQVQRTVERCRDTDTDITNTYATARDGRIWRSRQWVSDQIGYLEITVVRP